MSLSRTGRAAAMLARARRDRTPLDPFAEDLAPRSIAEAHAVQDALVALLGEAATGWKTAGIEDGKVMRGAILASRTYRSPARVKASDMPLLGVEGEIAFRFDRALPPRAEPYAMADVAAAVAALPVIEIVDSRFRSYRDTPLLDRLCDCMSNGALICGAPRPDWRAFDLARLPVRLSADGEVLFEGVGGHSSGDPLLPALALANELRRSVGIEAGRIVTTGTFTGLRFAAPGQKLRLDFEGFGQVEVSFEP